MCCALCACSAFDPAKLEPRAPGDTPRDDGGQVGAKGGAGGDVTPSTERDGGADGGGTSDSGAKDGGTTQGCVPNLAPDAGACPELCPELCNGRDDDCDGEYDGEKADLDCAAPHTNALCDLGTCLIVECDDGYRDCDGKVSNGCEVAPTDAKNCGGCGQVCKLQNAIAGCENDACVAIGCKDGFGDCDGDRKSCELTTRTLTDCGTCDTPCGELPQATPQCDQGSCGVAACLGNYGDCDGRGDNGCETKLETLQHCAGCNVPCAKASCAGGVCTAVLCVAPLADCNRDEADCEVDTAGDPAHCGGCDQACAFTATTPHAALACTAGTCGASCDQDFGDCDGSYESGCETALLTTSAHCGGCGNDCAAVLPHVASGSCAGATCGVVTCDAGWEDCDGVAVNGCERDVSALGPCSPDTGCTKVVSGTHEYQFCTTPRTRDDARTKCRLQTGGDLARVDDATENALLTANRTTDSWLGGGDGALEGTFRWLDDGVPFWKGPASGAAVLGKYASFSSGQPDDYQGAEDCLELWPDGTWNDNACGSTRGFICEVTPDDCASDGSKRSPGQCGCGMPDADTDADGFADCVEGCDSDVSKQAPGLCGCGVVDSSVNTDGDGALDCNDGCDADPTKTGLCLGYTPTTFDPNTINWSAQPSSTLNCNTTITVNSTDPDGTGAGVATLTGWCGTAPTPVAQSRSGGPDVVIIPLKGLDLPSGYTLRLIGNRPVILAVDGNATIGGIIDANGSGTTPGAGGNWSCGTSAGGNASGGSCTGGSEGGGGGGFGTAGGSGGNGGGSNTIGAGGVARGGATLTPLWGGCPGGLGGGSGTDAVGGAGGGAVQLTVSGTLTVTGTIRANGGVGAVGSCGNEAGGGGGGSGGAILLEATTLTTTGATLSTNGGSGGRSGSNASGGAGSTSASAAGGTGASDSANGGGGGGGGYGRISTVDH